RQPSIDDVREIYEVRLAIEGMATVLVTQRGASPGLRGFRARLAAFRDRDDPEAIERMHRVGWDFHDAIVAATGNRRMRQMYEALRMPIMALRSGRPVDAEQARRSLVEHLAILDAIEAGDATLAQRRMSDHLAGVLEARVRLSTSGVLALAAIEPPSAGTQAGTQQSTARKRRG
ncbi:GntR family transcriptional regulator, partial [Elioraea sp.]|uniref:GntR family transcriptional regulator n=1 Tax=Elioraea sp. TaxID=2185103 RepID=UPI003F7240A9